MIELRHLRYFVAVAEELHFGRAAEKLHMAQSPLSHQIRQLEQQLGVVLIDRDHHVAGLTDAGRAFLDDARGVLAALDQAVERTRRAGRGELGSVKVGYVPEMTAELLPPVLRLHGQSHPQVSVSLSQGTTGPLLEATRRRDVDVAFVRSPGRLDDLNYEQLVDEALCAALPADHPLAGRTVSLSQLRNEPFITLGRDAPQGLRVDVESACARASIASSPAHEADSPTAVLLLVAAGAGTALVPASVARHYPVPNVRFSDLADGDRTGGGLCWRRDETSTVVLEFIDSARRALGNRDDPAGA